ncbi:MAG TPA: type II toxin-antitoxin system VapC family toxin [Candidatus Acidoferrum sp.]|nr:type II toxin-antitoxin system VapC family toxin [Candidatus Acidoferrum sp.]
MKYILDTCALIWLVNGDSQLSPEATRICAHPESQLYVSAVSAWEIALKVARRKLSLRTPPEDWWWRALAQHQLEELPITSRIAIAAAALAPIHNDPFDRVLVATAAEHGLRILTSDRVFSQYRNVGVVW